MPAFVDVGVDAATEADRKRRQETAGAAHFEAHARAAVNQRIARADQPFALSHEASSAIDATVASGERSARPARLCAPYVTATPVPRRCAQAPGRASYRRS